MKKRTRVDTLADITKNKKKDSRKLQKQVDNQHTQTHPTNIVLTNKHKMRHTKKIGDIFNYCASTDTTNVSHNKVVLSADPESE